MATGNIHKKLVTITRVVRGIPSRTDIQTHKHTHTQMCSSQYFATAPAGEINIEHFKVKPIENGLNCLAVNVHYMIDRRTGTVSQKARNLWRQFCQFLTDFQSSFTGRFSS